MEMAGSFSDCGAYSRCAKLPARLFCSPSFWERVCVLQAAGPFLMVHQPCFERFSSCSSSTQAGTPMSSLPDSTTRPSPIHRPKSPPPASLGRVLALALLCPVCSFEGLETRIHRSIPSTTIIDSLHYFPLIGFCVVLFPLFVSLDRVGPVKSKTVHRRNIAARPPRT